jgi:hypothetical protein
LTGNEGGIDEKHRSQLETVGWVVVYRTNSDNFNFPSADFLAPAMRAEAKSISSIDG